MAINCGAIPANLIESELFGYKAGSFTGATKDKKGLIEEAEGGLVVPEPFTQSRLDALLVSMLEDKAARQRWQVNALAFAETADIYSNAEHAADLILKDRA